ASAAPSQLQRSVGQCSRHCHSTQIARTLVSSRYNETKTALRRSIVCSVLPFNNQPFNNQSPNSQPSSRRPSVPRLRGHLSAGDRGSLVHWRASALPHPPRLHARGRKHRSPAPPATLPV